jgi:hypothetical protein
MLMRRKKKVGLFERSPASQSKTGLRTAVGNSNTNFSMSNISLTWLSELSKNQPRQFGFCRAVLKLRRLGVIAAIASPVGPPAFGLWADERG